MIKWELVLGADVLYEFIHSYQVGQDGWKRNSELRTIIPQHKIVISTILRKYYEDYFYNHYIEDIDYLMSLFDEEASYADSMFFPVITKACDVENAIKEIIAQRNQSIIVCDTQAHYNKYKSCINEKRLIKSDKLLDMNISNIVYRNSVIFSTDLQPDEIDYYYDWLREMFTGEKNIDIVDPYLGTFRIMTCFEEKYIEHIEKGTTIKIYTYIDENDKITKEYWSKFDKRVKDRELTIFIYDVSKSNRIDEIHDRRIYLNTTQKHITIGHGLDVFIKSQQRGKTALGDSHITIDNDMRKIRQIRGYAKKEFDYNIMAYK